MKAEIRRSHPLPASGLPGLIAKSVGYEITLLRNETWPTLGAEYGVCHVLGRERAFSCPMLFDFECSYLSFRAWPRNLTSDYDYSSYPSLPLP